MMKCVPAGAPPFCVRTPCPKQTHRAKACSDGDFPHLDVQRNVFGCEGISTCIFPHESVAVTLICIKSPIMFVGHSKARRNF